MANNPIRFWQGLEENLPTSNLVAGHIYHCTDTKNTYLVNSNLQYELFSRATTGIVCGTCSTAAATAAKVINLTNNPNWKLETGALLAIKFTATNTADNPTFNVNGTGAKPIWYGTSQISTGSKSYAGYAGRYCEYIYDGTQYVFVGWSYDTNSTYTNTTLGQIYGTCPTAGSTLAKTVSFSSFKLTTGGIVSIKFTNAVPAGATLNINSTGAKAIYYKGAAIIDGIIGAGETATMQYNGTYFHVLSVDRSRFQTSLVPYGVSIEASETSKVDINTVEYLKVGNYFCSSNEKAKGVENIPMVGTAFMMTVSSPLSTVVDNETTSTQYCYSNGSKVWSYGPWNKVIKSNDLPTSLKNPKALTIDGVEYDGSTAVTINTMKEFMIVFNSDAAGNYTANKTFEEIYDAQQKGYLITAYAPVYFTANGETDGSKDKFITAYNDIYSDEDGEELLLEFYFDNAGIYHRLYYTGERRPHVNGGRPSVTIQHGESPLNLAFVGAIGRPEFEQFQEYVYTLSDNYHTPTIAATNTTTALTGSSGTSNTKIATGTGKNDMYVPVATATSAGVTIVYPAASCTTFSSDAGTVTPLAVQKGAKMFAITRPSSSTTNGVVRYSNTTGDVKDSKIYIQDVTNTKDSSKKANVLCVPAEGDKKMVYGYCTDQVDGTSFIGGLFAADATSFPYNAGLAIGGTSGNLLWKGARVLTTDDANVTGANRALISDGSKKIVSSSVTSTELGYLSGVTSGIQSQLNTKVSSEDPVFSGALTLNTRSGEVGQYSVALGASCEASAQLSYAEGMQTNATGSFSHAEGFGATAGGQSSHAEGDHTTANGNASHAEGLGTVASSLNQHAQGKYNIEDTTNTYAHIVGNGMAVRRSNAHTLDWDGNAWYAGNVYSGSDTSEGNRLIKRSEITYGTTDIGAGAPLATGTLYFVYE